LSTQAGLVPQRLGTGAVQQCDLGVVAYRLGPTPWERAATEGAAQGAALFDREEADRAAIGRDYTFFFDLGCFDGLTDAQRAIMAAGVTAAAAPKATMLLFASHPGRRGRLPRGASRTDVEQALTGWTVIDEEHAGTSGVPGPLKKAAPLWYRLHRS